LTPGQTKCNVRLWLLLSHSNLAQCPTHQSCGLRQGGAGCPNDDLENALHLLDGDPSHPDRTIPLCTVRCRNFNMVETLAEKWLKAGGICQLPVPSELVTLADHHPIEIRKLSLKAIHGAIWRLSDEWVIQLNEDDTPAEQRFTLFHEAFHIFVLSHYQMASAYPHHVSRGSFMEQMANWFAGCILQPRKWLAREYALTQDLEKLAAVFDTTPALVYVRLKRLGLT
jgi:hypothetical protein